MKALELKVFPKPTSPQFTYGGNPYGDQVRRERKVILSKRFTDSELSAEYHRAKWTGLMAEKYGGLSDEGRDKIQTVARFMELPYYDEEL